MELDMLPTDLFFEFSLRLSITDMMMLRAVNKKLRSLLIDDQVNKLLPHQVYQYYRMVAHFMKEIVAFDTSIMRSGKTATACAIAVKLNLELTVFCPLRVIPVWKQFSEMFGCKKVNIISYTQILNCDYVKSKDNPIVTLRWKKRCNRGTMLIFDEAHRLKNFNTKQSKIAISLIKAIHNSPFEIENTNTNDKVFRPSYSSNLKRSRVLCLSGTLYDKPEHSPQVFKILGIMKDEQILKYDPANGYTLLGAREIIDALPLSARDYNMYEKDLESKKTKITMHKLVVRFIKDKYFFAMPDQNKAKGSDFANLFLKVNQEEKGKLQKKLNSLFKSVSDPNPVSDGKVFKLMRKIAIIKSGIFIRESIRILKDPYVKLVIAFNHIHPIEICLEMLEKYKPLAIYGGVKNSEKIIETFNKSKKRRLLIVNSVTISEGVALHDPDGKFKRIMLICPYYNITAQHQLSYRVCSPTSVTIPTIRFIYGLEFEQELSLLESLFTKSKVITGLKDKKYDHIKLPSEHKCLYLNNDIETEISKLEMKQKFNKEIKTYNDLYPKKKKE